MEFEKIIKGEICPYCNCPTILVKGDVVYPHKLTEVPRPGYLNKKYYLCIINTDHYVGTYADNTTSLGRLANSSLRILKSNGHRAFDPLWKEKIASGSESKIFVSRINVFLAIRYTCPFAI